MKTALVLSIPSQNITQAFKIQKIDSSNISQIKKGIEIDLRSIIPATFYDVNFTVDGLLLFKKETVSDSSEKIRKVYCTEITSFAELPIYDAETDIGTGSPGEVVELYDKGLKIATADSCIVIKCFQVESGKRMSPVEYFRGHPSIIGSFFK